MSEKGANKSIKDLIHWYGIIIIVLLSIALLAYLAIDLLPQQKALALKEILATIFLDYKIYSFIAVGFIAQLIDSTLGMAYGVSSTSFLMATGIHPKMASAAVHTSEIFTNGVSGLSHIRMGNVDKGLLLSLLIPGALGAGTGAYLLSVFDGHLIKPFVSLYLLLMGIYIILKAIKERIHVKDNNYKGASILALIGGFVAAIGGGGWGSVVTATLIGTGNHPRKVIGSVNTAKFLVALTASIVFFIYIDNLLDMFSVILGLIIGGSLSAPLGTYITRLIPVKIAMIAVGILIISLSCFSLYKFIL
ncbi:MAG: sulfite exporter TauE/SafE family protein [Chitinophagales bacterium]|nr:sulfite exporter TauE/SafE family protein [Chitinophagales bacterium]